MLNDQKDAQMAQSHIHYSLAILTELNQVRSYPLSTSLAAQPFSNDTDILYLAYQNHCSHLEC